MIDKNRVIKLTVIWFGLVFLVPLITISIILPMFTNIDITMEILPWIMLLSLGIGLIVYGVAKGYLHLGKIFLVLGAFITIVTGLFLYGSVDYQGVGFDLNPYDKQRLYQLSNTDINLFVGIGAVGVVMFGFGLLQNWNRLLYGWGGR